MALRSGVRGGLAGAGAWARAAVTAAALAVGVTGASSISAGVVWPQQTAGSARGPVTRLAGAYWKSLTSGEKQSYVNGFLAGAAAEQVRSRVVAGRSAREGREGGEGGGGGGGGGGGDTVKPSGVIDAEHGRHSLHFPFAPTVYASQLDDFYWWDNHALVPVVDAMTQVNAQLMEQQQGGGP